MHSPIAAWPLFPGALLALALSTLSCTVATSETDSSSESSSLQAARVPIAVDFSDCVESIGVEVVPTPVVRGQVPAGFTLAGEAAPVTPVVVRTANCARLALSRAFPEADAAADAESAATSNPRPISIVQIGALLVPPDGTGDVNVYTLWYHTNNLRLLAALHYAGVQATAAFVNYDYRAASSTLNVSLLSLQNTLTLRGSVGPLNTPAVPFVSNWWVSTAQGTVKFSTTVPALVISTADLTLQATSGSAVTALLGTTSSFSALEQFNGFSSAQGRF
jgi:hypothetical protein